MISIRLNPYTNVHCLGKITLYLMLGNVIRVDKVNSTSVSSVFLVEVNNSFPTN